MAFARYRETSKRDRRSFTNWVVKLNHYDELIVEGTLESGRRARTKPIAEKLGALKIQSKFGHLYYLIGNMNDARYEIPGFVRLKFHSGFPEDWKTVVETWKSFVNSATDTDIRLSCMSDVEGGIKLSINRHDDSPLPVRSNPEAIATDIETRSVDRNATKENIPSGAAVHQNLEKSIADNNNGETRSRKNIRQLTGWTPLAVPDETGEYHLIFRGTLLSTTGHPVNRNHETNAISRRLSARIIETMNEELYELIGDLNNTKRDVPKELAIWCRYGCPKRINSFCEKWRILKSGDINNSFASTHSVARKKRKRILTGSTHDSSRSDTSVDENLIFNKEPEASSLNNSPRGNCWPKVKRKLGTDLMETSRRDTDIKKIQSSLGKREISPVKKSSSLYCVYNKCAQLTDNVLSDGV